MPNLTDGGLPWHRFLRQAGALIFVLVIGIVLGEKPTLASVVNAPKPCLAGGPVVVRVFDKPAQFEMIPPNRIVFEVSRHDQRARLSGSQRDDSAADLNLRLVFRAIRLAQEDIRFNPLWSRPRLPDIDDNAVDSDREFFSQRRPKAPNAQFGTMCGDEFFATSLSGNHRGFGGYGCVMRAAFNQ